MTKSWLMSWLDAMQANEPRLCRKRSKEVRVEEAEEGTEFDIDYNRMVL